MASLLAGVTIVFAVAFAIATLLHRASAAARHVVWTCAFAAVLLLAPLRWRLPHRVIATNLPAVATTRVSAGTASSDSDFHLATILPALWALGTLVMTMRLVRNAIRLRTIIRTARGQRPVMTTPRIRGPVAAGLFRPVVLLPDTSETWTLSRRRAVLAHEAAHIRRQDPAILLAAHIAAALYWFHPLCWLAVARLRAESERACDDAALRIGLLPSGYAGHLLDLACKFDTQLAIPMATTSQLESRVKSILDPMTNRSFSPRASWSAAVILTVAVLAPLTTFTVKAQQANAGSATITGMVTDPSGARVPGAKVTATNSDTGYEETAVAKGDGGYSFSGMPAGHYAIEAQVPGFARFRVNDLALVSGGALQVYAHLAVGKILERISVAAQGAPKSSTAPVSAAPQRIRVGGMLQAAALLKQVKPIYPADLRTQGIEGAVMLQAIISKEGVPHSIRVVKSAVNQPMVDAAMDAVTQWRYRPALLNGEPIEVVSTIQVDFTLSQ